MKTIIALLVATTLSAAAGTLRDDANLFGPDKARVDAALVNSKVWVESMVKRPDDIKAYADTRIAQLGDGFLILITTQPKAWRISMNPVGLAASPRTEAVGNKMAATFKQGRMADGVIAAAVELTALTKPAAAFPWFWVIGGVIIIGAFGALLVYWIGRGLREKQEQERQRAEAEEEAARSSRAQREAEERERDREELRKQRAEQRKADAERQAREAEERRNRPVPPVEPRPQPRNAAVRERHPFPEPIVNPYESMNRAQRVEVVHRYESHPSYHSGLLDDPVAFLLFMTMVQNQSQSREHPFVQMMQNPSPPPAPAPRRREPEPEPELERPSRSYRSEPEPSRSDSSGSSGGWSSDSPSSSDSGSSASDSSSSASDSSGSGGSW